MRVSFSASEAQPANSHSVPLKPSAHMHVKPSTPSTHVPSFSQGAEAHSFTSVSHCAPSNPATHTQEKPST